LDAGRNGRLAAAQDLLNRCTPCRVGVDVQAQSGTVLFQWGDVLYGDVEVGLPAGDQTAVSGPVHQGCLRAVFGAQSLLELTALFMGYQGVPAEGLHMGVAGLNSLWLPH